ncbi:MAG: MFS transporter [Planctomycetes bacterium]|nr:MFS transporter [Planctomycetota bacterium]
MQAGGPRGGRSSLRRPGSACNVSGLPHLERQLRLLRAYALVTYPFACVPFLFLFFRDHGIGEGAYGEIVGAYYLAMFVAEVPTGILADRIGRKPMLVAGPLLLAAGFAVLVLFPHYGTFVAGEVLLGLGHAVLSGPPTVLLYETLREHGQQHRYLQEESRIAGLRMLGTGSAFLLGGVLARFGNATHDAYGLAIVATSVLCGGAALLALGLHERTAAGAAAPREFLRQLRGDLAKPAVVWLFGYWIVLFTLLRYPFHNYQPYLVAAGRSQPLLLDPLFLGVLFATLNLAAAPMSSQVPRLVATVGRRVLFWGMPLLLCGSLLVMAWERSAAADGADARLVWLGIGMFFVQQVPFGMHWALLYEFVNHRIGAAARTTVLSALSLGTRSCYALCNVLLFHTQERRGLPFTLALVGGVGVAATCTVLWLRPRGLLRGREPIA